MRYRGRRGSNLRVVEDHGVRASQNGGCRAPVLVEGYKFGAGKLTAENFESGTRRPAKAVYGLIGIADGEHVPFFPRQHSKYFYLSEVGVLKFINQKKAQTLPYVGEQLGILVQQFVGIA